MALLGTLLFSCAEESGGFEWDRQLVSMGPVFRHSEWSGAVGFVVAGSRPVELLGVRTSCGCIHPEARVHGGGMLTPGLHAAGTRGEVVLRVRPRREKRNVDESVPMAWRFEGEADLRFTEFRVQGEVVDAWHVEPDAIRLENVAPGEQPRFVVRWRALTPVKGTGEVVFEGTGVHLADAGEAGNAGTTAGTVAVRGTAIRPESGYEASGVIKLMGVAPSAPDVPVRVTFARSVIADPDRVVSLVAQADGSFSAQVRLRLAEAVAAAGTRVELASRVEVEPSDMADSLAIRSEKVSAHEVCLSISCPRETVQVRRFGGLVIHHGIRTEPPVKLLWYLRGGPANR